jgi:hypothetical protein
LAHRTTGVLGLVMGRALLLYAADRLERAPCLLHSRRLGPRRWMTALLLQGEGSLLKPDSGFLQPCLHLSSSLASTRGRTDGLRPWEGSCKQVRSIGVTPETRARVHARESLSYHQAQVSTSDCHVDPICSGQDGAHLRLKRL